MEDRLAQVEFKDKLGMRLSIATKLMLSFLLVIAVVSGVFVAVGVRTINARIVSEAQERIRNDLNAAREIYLGELNDINDVVRFTADSLFLRSALVTDNVRRYTDELVRVREREGLDVLTVVDKSGDVLLRTSNVDRIGGKQGQDELVRAVLSSNEPVAATSIVSADDLREESPALAEAAYVRFVDTPKARARPEIEETSGMMLRAAAPILDYDNNIIGVLHGGVLLNRNYGIVDKAKQTVFQDVEYNGKDIGTATVFQDDVRISTNVIGTDGSRAVGTRVTEEVYDRVVGQGQPWVDRAYVVNDWYITAYEPIFNISSEIVGILYVGILEQKYVDIRNRTVLTFLGITLAGALVSVALSYFISRRISVPIRELASASRKIARGNLDTRVEIAPGDELGELAETFNVMAAALKERDEQLKELARSKIMESERLALVGQLAANVAHELNNPLQGIVTYSHLLLETTRDNGSTTQSIEKIAAQASRCRDIIRGLLDFSRQRKPDKTVCNINSILEGSLALLEGQALFHNIEIVTELEDDVPRVVVDPSQMERVFINLVINAAEAMDGSGRLHLATRFDAVDGFVEVEVTDTGHGIPLEDLDRIFDPFFTTKDVGHGTGLGLAISYGIVKEHGGTVSVESEVGRGTSFVIRLPATVEKEGQTGGG